MSISEAKLKQILEGHLHWIREDCHGWQYMKADLSRANLSEADLYGANLHGADLYGANGTDLIPIACPYTGSFIGWKRVPCGLIIKLEIPEDAKRSSAASRKCRASKAKVLEIQNVDGSKSDAIKAVSSKGGIYKVGEEVLPDYWDDNRWNECSHGIHFFLTRCEAERWDV